MKNHLALFHKTKQLNDKMTKFLTNIVEAGVIFEKAITIYIHKSVNRDFLKYKQKISELESQNDTLRREIEAELYQQMIIPGMRSDILDLTEGCDAVINQYEALVILWSIEAPKIPANLYPKLQELTHITLNCVQALVQGVQSFLAGQMSVENEIQECYFLEHKIDLLGQDLKLLIFQNKRLNLARQLQLKDMVNNLEELSDKAEDAADKLKIISVKHAL
ncbi:MAG: DUF47 family protein [Alphaproteobacteria bacterium]|nr:DUF47 family protein [Alphaproteobacteria bacterium]